MKTKALIARHYGDTDALEFVEEDLPPLEAGRARIEVRAAGINPIDARKMTGEVKFGALPQRFGAEFAGVIIELAGDAGHWSIGDEVLGSGTGTHATIVDIPIGNLVARPEAVDWTVAGSVAAAAQTAMTLVQELGDAGSVLVHGGAGGVGTVLIQLAREKGIEIVATASQANHDYLRALGATPIAYGQSLAERIAHAHPAPFDAAIILSGTADATAASLATVKADGDIASITGVPAPSPRVRATGSKRNIADLRYVIERVAAGQIKWEISQTYPFSDAATGFAAVLDGHTRGKRVLTF